MSATMPNVRQVGAAAVFLGAWSERELLPAGPNMHCLRCDGSAMVMLCVFVFSALLTINMHCLRCDGSAMVMLCVFVFSALLTISQTLTLFTTPATERAGACHLFKKSTYLLHCTRRLPSGWAPGCTPPTSGLFPWLSLSRCEHMCVQTRPRLNFEAQHLTTSLWPLPLDKAPHPPTHLKGYTHTHSHTH